MFFLDFGDLQLGKNNEQPSITNPKVAKGTLFQEKPKDQPNGQKIDVENFRRLLLAWLVGILSGQLDDKGSAPASGSNPVKPASGSSDTDKPQDGKKDKGDSTDGSGKGKQAQSGSNQQTLPVRPKS